MNKTIELIENRMSLRKYADKEVTKEELDIILKSAMRAPTAGNMMMYSVLVVRDEEKKKILSQTCDNQPFIARSPVVLIFLADMQRMYDYFESCEVREYCERENISYETPDLSRLFLGAGDAFIAAQNAVIAAESIGIGSCYIGDIVENYEIHRKLFDLPNWVFPVSMLCLGHYPENMKRIKTPRHDQKFIVHNEKYKHLSKKEFIDMYKENEKYVKPNNNVNAENFGQLIYARKFAGDCMVEMERSINEMLKAWKTK